MASKLPLIIFLIISLFFLVPLAFMIYGSTVPVFKSTQYTLKFLIQAFTAKNTPTLLINTLEYGGGGALLGVLLATVYAWLMERTDVPAKKFLRLLPILPLTLPLLVKGFAWIFLFSPRIGLVNLSLESALGLANPPFNIFSMAGMIFAWGVGGIPLAYLMIEPAFRSIDPSLEEASRAGGAGALRTLFRVTLPIISPAIVTAFLLLFIAGVENFDYPFILGTEVGINTFATEVYDLVDIFHDTSLASAYSIIFLIITLVLISFYLYSVRKSFRFIVVTGKATQPTLFRLGRKRWLGLAICLGIMTFAFILPAGMIVLMSLVPFYTVGGATSPFAHLTLENYVKAFQVQDFQLAVINSFELSFAAAVLTTIIATVMSYTLIKSKTIGKKVLDYLASLPLAFPGIVYAIGLIWTFLTIPGLGYIYGTNWILLFSLIIIWLPYAIRIVSTSLIQIADEMEEASSVLGGSWLRTFTRVTMPLLRNGMVNSFIYVMVDSFRELGAVVLLSNASSILLIVLILNLFETTASSLPVVAALSTLMTLMLAATIIVTRLVTRSRRPRR
ncbi:MAG: iron ABC transporter permease [Nitrososphaerota archaeon]|nr:iron ABC transporter permease [Nitrososphaerota archaeon]